MDETLIKRFCALCGQTKTVNSPKYIIKRLFVVEGKENLDLGFMCPECYKHLADGKVFTKPRR